MPGLIGTGIYQDQQAQQSFAGLAQREQERQSENKQIKAANLNAKVSATGTGAALGFAAGGSSAALSGAVGGSWAGPVGALIGAGVGFLASELF